MVEVESRHVPAIRILDASIRYNMVARLKTRRTGPYLIMERNEVSQWRTIAGSYRYKTRALQLRNSSGWHGPLVEPMWLSRLPLVSYPAVAGFSTPDIGGLCRLTHASAGWGLKARLDALLWGTWSWSSYSQRQRPPYDDQCRTHSGLDWFNISSFKVDTHLHCVSKKVPTFKLSVTLSNLNRFSKFLHRLKAYEICYKTRKTRTTLPTSS